SDTVFSLVLSATDKAAAALLLNKDGTASVDSTTYNLAAAEDWAAGADAAVVVADLTGNGITVSNVAVPTITSSTYNSGSGVLVVTGTGFTHLAGAANDVIANKFTLRGQGGATYTLTDTANVEVGSDTVFSLVLSATDKAAAALLLNKDGTASVDSTTYNLAAAEDWEAGASVAVTIADLTGNVITVGGNNVAPSIGGAVAAQSVADNATLLPFSTLTITDPDVGATEIVRVALDAAAKGTFTAASLIASGFSTADSGLTYTHAAGTPMAVQAAIRALVFQPGSGRLGVGQTETTTFTVSANDGIAGVVSNTTTTVVATGVNLAPSALGLSSLTVNQNAGNNAPVGTLSATDPNPGDTHTYALISGNGVNDSGNAVFNIAGSTLRISQPASQLPGAYNILVRATDAGGLTVDKPLTIVLDDGRAPVVSSFNRVQSDPTNRASVDYTVTFSENVSGVDAGDFAIVTTGTAAGAIGAVTQISSNTYTVKVNGLIGDGTLRVDLKSSGTGITDAVNTPIAAGFAGQTYTVDHTAPTNTIATLAFSSDTGVSSTDFVTETAQQIISGTLMDALAVNEFVQVSLDNGGTWIAATAVAGSSVWSLASQMLSGAAVMKVRVVDNVGNVGVERAQAYSISGPQEFPSPPVLPSPPDTDRDSIPQSIEDGVTSLSGSKGGANGDGNGDGIADGLQTSVASLPWSVNAGGQIRYVTLSNDQNLSLSQVQTKAIPQNLPANVRLPLGLLAFDVDGVAIGSAVKMSVFIDAGIAFNGYWKQNKVGRWVDIADSITSVGNKVRVDFTLRDGGEFDLDGVANGHISDPGGPGFLQATSLAVSALALPDAAPRNAKALDFQVTFSDSVRNVDVNDFSIASTGSAKGAITRVDKISDSVYRVHVDNVAGDGSIAVSLNRLTTDITDLNNNLISSSFTSAPHVLQGDIGLRSNTDKIAGLYALLYHRAPDQSGLAYWNQEMKQGKTIFDIAREFAGHSRFLSDFGSASNRQYVEAIYQQGLGSAGDDKGIAYWTAKINLGETRADMLAEFTIASLTANLVAAHDAHAITDAEYVVAAARQNSLLNRIDVGTAFVNQFGALSNPLAALDSDKAYHAAQLVQAKIDGTDASLQQALTQLHVATTIEAVLLQFMLAASVQLIGQSEQVATFT
ncbi:MAG: DUF4214 domain-containing protein, partial [Herminiimonas sp.]|nr:DUF4214 domain-containing protein [Herminiimonas sp.]